MAITRPLNVEDGCKCYRKQHWNTPVSLRDPVSTYMWAVHLCHTFQKSSHRWEQLILHHQSKQSWGKLKTYWKHNLLYTQNCWLLEYDTADGAVLSHRTGKQGNLTSHYSLLSLEQSQKRKETEIYYSKNSNLWLCSPEPIAENSPLTSL